MIGSKLDEHADCYRPAKFKVSANLEEVERGASKVSLKFTFTFVTDPRIAKYQIEGSSTIEGQMEHIKKVLTPHPSTRVPLVLYDIYQQVYSSIFVLSKTIDTPCPSPELLSSSPATPSTKEDIQQGSKEAALVAPDEKISV